MPSIPLDRVHPGMVVGADVLDQGGRCLVPLGAELTQRTIDALESWGVRAVEVEGEDPVEEVDPMEIEAAKAAIASRFARGGTEHPFVRAVLHEAARAYVRHQAQTPKPAGIDAS